MRAPVPSFPLVWDLGVRVFHWTLVVAVATLALTGFGLVPFSLAVHLAVGYVLIGLLAFRLVWGFSGSTYARFRSFLFGPRAVLHHLREIATGTAVHKVGHNPVGAQMVFVVLFVLAALIVTGLVTLGGTDKQGPLALVTSFATGENARALHRIFAFGLLALIPLHLFGVAFESLRSRHNLVGTMWTGRGRPGTPIYIQSPNYGRAGVTLALATAVAVPGWFMLAAKPGLGVPAAPLLPLYRQSCGECHTAHHPSLASAATWTAVMTGLDRHFGEDATLSDEAAAALSAYLAQNAAETFDTKAAHRIGAATSPATLRATETPFWRERHAALPKSLFRARKIGSAANCAGCHGDAERGLFQPQSVTIPQEDQP